MAYSEHTCRVAFFRSDLECFSEWARGINLDLPFETPELLCGMVLLCTRSWTRSIPKFILPSSQAFSDDSTWLKLHTGAGLSIQRNLNELSSRSSRGYETGVILQQYRCEHDQRTCLLAPCRTSLGDCADDLQTPDANANQRRQRMKTTQISYLLL